MHRDEALLIKCFDSAEDGKARFAAHTGFDDPTSPPDAPVRVLSYGHLFSILSLRKP